MRTTSAPSAANCFCTSGMSWIAESPCAAWRRSPEACRPAPGCRSSWRRRSRAARLRRWSGPRGAGRGACIPPTPSARSLPERICVHGRGMVAKASWCGRRPRRSGPARRPGTARAGCRRRPVSLNSSAPRCVKLPTPAEAYCSFPGCSLASAISSLTDLTGSSGLTEITFGAEASIATGVNDFDRLVGQLVHPGIDGDRASRRAAACSRPSARCATGSVPTTPPAPARFSTMTCWPSRLPICGGDQRGRRCR